jgi:diadenosine tetraphosphate (Ap4A) HIT family hydrolase
MNILLKVNKKMMELKNCVFCKIANKEGPKTEILFENDRIVIFNDIKPASNHHFLAIPKVHVANPKCLTLDDKELGEYLPFWSIR